MAAVVRVKRRFNDEVADSLILLCKRQKVDLPSTQEDITAQDGVQSVFKFAGTIPIKDNTVAQCVKQAISKEKLQREYKRHDVNVREKCSVRRNSRAINARYKITATKRALDLASLCPITDKDVSSSSDLSAYGTEMDGERRYILYDVEKDEWPVKTAASNETIMCNGVQMIREKVLPSAAGPIGFPGPSAVNQSVSSDDGFVYDLYYTNNAQFDYKEALDNVLTNVAIEAFRDELVYEHQNSSEDECLDDDDDENAENYYRNDYPEEDTDFLDSHRAADYFCNDDIAGGFEDDLYNDIDFDLDRRLNVYASESDDEKLGET